MSEDAKPTVDMRMLASERWPVPPWHFEKIAAELECPERERMLSVIQRMGRQAAPDFSSLDWDAELERYGELEYPTYYQQPFHSVPGGYLSEQAALGDRRAMEAIYEEAHPERSLGLRQVLATLVPADALRIVDLGAGTCDGPAAVARRLPVARVVALEISPFMLTVGRHQNADVPNLEFARGLAEDTGLAAGSVDCVTITLVFHECPDTVKSAILTECRRLLRPGGTLVLSDTPQGDLDDYRGFYEPYKEQWRVFDPAASVAAAGFDSIESSHVAPPLWSLSARSPGPV